MRDLTDVEQAFALGDKDTLAKLQQSAETFKGLERHPAYQDFVSRLREAISAVREDILSGIGTLSEKELVSKSKFLAGLEFVMDLLHEKIEIWNESTRYLEELSKEEGKSSEGNVMLPDSTL